MQVRVRVRATEACRRFGESSRERRGCQSEQRPRGGPWALGGGGTVHSACVITLSPVTRRRWLLPWSSSAGPHSIFRGKACRGALLRMGGPRVAQTEPWRQYQCWYSNLVRAVSQSGEEGRAPWLHGGWGGACTVRYHQQYAVWDAADGPKHTSNTGTPNQPSAQHVARPAVHSTLLRKSWCMLQVLQYVQGSTQTEDAVLEVPGGVCCLPAIIARSSHPRVQTQGGAVRVKPRLPIPAVCVVQAMAAAPCG